MQFMNFSLDVLVKNLSNNDFKYLSQEFSSNLLELVKQKGVYPYEYMDSFKKFSEDKLPDRCEFFSSLKDECISEKDYSHAINVWNTFKMNTMGDYQNLYLKTDVLLLTDVFEKFINTCLEYYGLDLCHYFSSPGLSWDAMLKLTGIELELNSDIEKGMREGISYVSKRHNKANNKYMECYDSRKESKFIMYLDAYNLYGWAMSQYFPYSEFKWLSRGEVYNSDVNSVSKNNSDGYILEIDLEYPDELHELYNDFPLASEKLKISHNMLSNYCSSIKNKYDIKIGGVNKLVPNLGIKSKYVLHYRNLQLYLSLGMKLVSVHRVLKFKQSVWLKKYIDFNTDKRKNAANSFEKDFFELMKEQEKRSEKNQCFNSQAC